MIHKKVEKQAVTKVDIVVVVVTAVVAFRWRVVFSPRRPINFINLFHQ